MAQKYQLQAMRCLPCVGGGGSALADSEGVYGSNFVGDYRTTAFTTSIAFTPSVTPEGVTAPPTQGSLFLFRKILRRFFFSYMHDPRRGDIAPPPGVKNVLLQFQYGSCHFFFRIGFCRFYRAMGGIFFPFWVIT